MTLTELRYIVTLAQEQHFGHAADRCNVSQPTLSIAVKKLEDELETAIFERSKTRVYPTPLGTKIIEQAQKVLEQAPMRARTSLPVLCISAPFLRSALISFQN